MHVVASNKVVLRRCLDRGNPTSLLNPRSGQTVDGRLRIHGRLYPICLFPLPAHLGFRAFPLPRVVGAPTKTWPSVSFLIPFTPFP